MNIRYINSIDITKLRISIEVLRGLVILGGLVKIFLVFLALVQFSNYCATGVA